MLEEMSEFFNRRVDGYEDHQLNAIEGAKTFYPFTASLLPCGDNAEVLDLGCGTGLELRYYFALNPTARVTCIDIADKMLRVLENNYADKNIITVKGSYFDVQFGTERYDAVVSVESLHHYDKSAKILLYKKVLKALKPDGYFILTDYFALSDDIENTLRENLLQYKKKQASPADIIYHYDTPLTLEHELHALQQAGFKSILTVGKWGATCAIRANK